MRRIGLNRAVAALALARMADATGNSILFIVIPLYVAKLPSLSIHLPVPLLVGFLLAIYGLINSFLQPLVGALSDRLNRRKLLLQIGLVVIGLGTLAFAWATRFVDLLVLRSVQGAAVAFTIPPSLAIMAAVSRRESRGGAMGFYTTGRMVGFAAGPLVGGFLQVHFGFNTAFYVGAALILLAALLVQLWVEDVRFEKVPGAPERPFRIIDPALLNAGILSAAMATFLMASAFSMMTALENEFNARLHMNAFGFSIAFSAMMIGRLVFQLPLGRLSDRVGRKPLIIMGLILTGVSTGFLGEVGSPLLLTIDRVVQGIAAAAVAAPAFALAADLSQRAGAGRQLSIVTMGFSLGIALGPLIAGGLTSIFFELPFLIGGILCLIGATLVWWLTPETVRGPSVWMKHWR